MRAFLAAFAILGASASAAAALPANPYGVWFGYGEKGNTVIMTVKGSPGLSIFCNRGSLTLGIVEHGRRNEHLAAGEALAVRFQADKGAPVATTAVARNDRSFEIAQPLTLIRQIVDARRVSFHITRANGKTFRRDYPVVGARKAMTEIAKDCPL